MSGSDIAFHVSALLICALLSAGLLYAGETVWAVAVVLVGVTCWLADVIATRWLR